MGLLAILGSYDIGQASVIAEGGRVLAIEGPEGTDAMLARVRGLRRRWWSHGKEPPAILVKAPKPGQDFRVDLPAIGPRTVARAAAAGLAGIGLAAGGVVVLERRATIAAADSAGLFIEGLA
jgi:DUF1009 family protein